MTAPHSISSGSTAVREAVATELIAHGEFSSTGNSYPNALLAADEVIKIVLAHTTNAALRTPALPSGEVEFDYAKLNDPDLVLLLTDLANLNVDDASEAALREAAKRLASSLPFARWADTIESASLTISPKGSKELDALAAEVRSYCGQK